MVVGNSLAACRASPAARNKSIYRPKEKGRTLYGGRPATKDSHILPILTITLPIALTTINFILFVYPELSIKPPTTRHLVDFLFRLMGIAVVIMDQRLTGTLPNPMVLEHSISYLIILQIEPCRYIPSLNNKTHGRKWLIDYS